jgi:hypothetical protein
VNDILATISDDALRRLYLYWKDKAGDRRFPGRPDIDPLDFAYVLGWVTLVDVLHDPLRFRFRLYGSELAHRHGLDLTGRYLDQHPDHQFGMMLQRSWEQVVTAGAPACVRYERKIGERKRRWESLRMPLSTDGTTIDMLLAGTRPID